MVLRTSDYLRKRMLEDAEKFVSHFAFRPEKRLQTLHPFKIRNDHTTGITENIRDHEDLVPAFIENQIRIGRGRAVGTLSENTTFKFAGIFAGNHAIDRARSKNVAWQSQ